MMPQQNVVRAPNTASYALLQPPPAVAQKMHKTERDPGAPKRNLSAYLLYQNAMREQFKAQNPDMSFGQLSKYTSAMYAQLSPEEKAAWQARAEADKARYKHELANYNPPPGYDRHGDQLPMVPHVPKGRGGKDAAAPKKNLSAYLLYQNAMRNKFTQENPGMSFGELSKYTSQMYNSLSVEEKNQWKYLAQQDKARYEAELAHYANPHMYHPAAAAPMMHQVVPPSTGKKQKAVRDPSLPKKSKGPYLVFAEEERPKIKSQFPDIKFTQMGAILGERWRALSKEEKERYEILAKNDKDRYSNELENYKRQQSVVPQQQNQYMMDPYQMNQPIYY